MPQGDKSKYTEKQKRPAEHIEKGYEEKEFSDENTEEVAPASDIKYNLAQPQTGS